MKTRQSIRYKNNSAQLQEICLKIMKNGTQNMHILGNLSKDKAAICIFICITTYINALNSN